MTTELRGHGGPAGHDVLGDLDGTVSSGTVQGIPVLHAAGTGNDITAGLFFRVGRADETLATSGITHLVEHLALHRLGLSDLHYNGATADTYTLFHVTGSEAEVVAYLNAVCAGLRNLPLERMETEKEILRTEARQGGGPARHMALWRYGARGYGLSGYNEIGTWALTPAQVGDWARTRFTRDNAVLWMTSDRVPEGLDLTLPEGTRIPTPDPTSALPVTPAYIHGDDGHVVLTSVVRRSAASSLFADVLGRALYQDLRQKGGFSYTAQAECSPRDAEYAHLLAYADALPQKQDAVVGGFVDTLARLRSGRIEQAELDSVRAKALRGLDQLDAAATSLPSLALSLLLGRRIVSPARARAELDAVTLDDLREVARETWESTLLQVPRAGLEWAGFTRAPLFSPSVANGTWHASFQDAAVGLVIGPEGVGLVSPEGPVTVRYDACAAMTAYPDGARALTGHDGFRVTIEPTLHEGVTPERIAVVDAGVPAEVVIRMPAREPGRIPPRPLKGRPALLPFGPRGTAWVTKAVLWAAGLVAAAWGLRCAVYTVTELISSAPDWGALASAWTVEFPLALLAWDRYRSWNRRRRI